MEIEEILNELEKNYNKIIDMIYEFGDELQNQIMQKSKKTGKMYCRDPCTFKALYATRKYGCSGFKDKTECLECPFRR